MVSINRKSEIETQTDDVKIVENDNNKNLPLFRRMFSIESATSNATNTSDYYNLPTLANEYSLCSYMIIVKLIELAISSVCLYCSTIKPIDTNTFYSILFPNVVFTNSIIVNSVITFSALLHYYINDLVLRIFNSILLILFFACGCVTAQLWYSSNVNLPFDVITILLILSILAFVNFMLYLIDVVLSVRLMIQ